VAPGEEGAEATGTVLVTPGTSALRIALRHCLVNVERRSHVLGYQVDIGELPGTPWRVALLAMGWAGPGDHVQTLVARVGRELGAPLIVSVVEARGVRGRTEYGDIVVATRLDLRSPLGQPSRRLVDAAELALLSSACFAPVSDRQGAAPWVSWSDVGAAAIVGEENSACLQAVYAVPVAEHLTVCAIGDAGVDRAVEAVVTVLGRLATDADPLALPPLPDRFAGREAELHRLLLHLDPSGAEEPGTHIALVRGMPGIGKTALAAVAAHHVADRGWFPGGAYWVTAGTDVREAVRRIESRLPGTHGPVLVVHDGMEPGEVLDLWSASISRRLHLLVTTRHGTAPLGARTSKAIVLEPLSAEAAQELLGDADTEAVARTAALCGGLPLALRLAARGPAPLDELPLRAEQEGGIFAVLGELRDVFDEEYRRLPTQQARMLRLLSVPPAGDLGRELVVGLSGDDARADLDALVAAGLVAHDASAQRWRLWPLVRAYVDHVVEHHPAAQQERAAARRDLWDFCTARTQNAVKRLGLGAADPDEERHGSRADAVAWLDGERQNLMSLATDPELVDTHEAVDFVLNLGPYLNWRRYFAECGFSCDVVLRTSMTRHEEAHVHNLRGAAHRGAGQLDEAVDAYRRALEICDADGDEWGRAKVHDALGAVYAEQGDRDTARQLLTDALETLRRLGDRRSQAEALMNLGLLSLSVGEYDEAHRSLAEALELFQSRGDALGTARAALNRADALCRNGDAEQAVAVASEAMRDFEKLADSHGVGRSWEVLARAHEAQRRHIQAQDAWSRAEAAYAQARDTAGAERARERDRILRERRARWDLRVVVTVTTAAFRVSSVRYAVQVSSGAVWRTLSAPGKPVRIDELPAAFIGAFGKNRLLEPSVPIEFALPVKHFDLAPHMWRGAGVPAGERLGEQRPVFIRASDRAASDATRLARWQALREATHLTTWHLPGTSGRPLVSPLNQGGPPIVLTQEDDLPPVPDGGIPFLCRPVSRGTGRRNMSLLLDDGHGVVLWSTDPHPADCGPECQRLLQLVEELISETRHVEELPERLWLFRATHRDHHLSLLYDDPSARLP
jgi:tetratricopeptide (TPR) repeat protein